MLKKVMIITLIFLVSFSLFTYATNNASVTPRKTHDEKENQTANMVDKSLTSELEFQEIYYYARRVSELYSKIGPGVALEAGIDQLLAADEGNCAQLAYIFARYLAQSGYEYKIIGLYHYSGLNHILVDVKYKKQTFAFDPTNGVFYGSGVLEILSDPSLVDTMFGDPRIDSSIYTTDYFFKGINKVEMNVNLNYAETNILLDEGNYTIESTDLFPYPNDLSGAIDNTTDTYLAGLKPLPNSFTIKFKEQVKFYRIYMKWYSPQDYATDFTIYYGPDERHLKELTHVKNYKNNDYNDFHFVSPVDLEAKVIKFVFNKTAGQNRILLEMLGLYQ